MTAVPYERMERATTNAREAFPHVPEVKALWTPASPTSDVCVELWLERGRAVVLPVDGHDQAITTDEARELLGRRR